MQTIQQLREEGDEKDRKIKELNIRLETLRKQPNNRASKELENILNNQELSFATTHDGGMMFKGRDSHNSIRAS